MVYSLKEKMPMDRLIEFCRRNHIRKLSLFGSAISDRMGPDSDIDLLVEFVPGARIGLIGFAGLQEELEAAIGRKVDLVPKRGLKPLIRDEVLSSAEVLYAA